MNLTMNDLKRKLLKLAIAPVPEEPAAPPIIVNITMPDVVGELMSRIGDGKGGIRTTTQTSQVPG